MHCAEEIGAQVSGIQGSTKEAVEAIRTITATMGDIGPALARFDTGDRLVPIRVQLDVQARTNLQIIEQMRICIHGLEEADGPHHQRVANELSNLAEAQLEAGRVADALATGREIILFDNAGVGASTGTAPGTVEGIAAGAAAFISGLGLATVRRLVDSYGGRVGVRSREGEGTVFWFEMPLAAEPRRLSPAR